MMRGMFAAISGLKQHQVMLDVTANDIANVNTLGYKSSRVTFQDSLTQMQRGAAAPTGGNGGSNAAQVGLGVGLGSVDNLMQSGALQTTGSPYDVAIQGDGWFRVAAGDPAAGPGSITDLQYTRAGNFARNNDGYLVTQDGRYVIGRNAATGGTDQFLQVPTGATDVAIGTDGALSFIPAGGGARVTAGWMQLAKFPNETGLERVNANRWRETPATGAPIIGSPGNGYGLTVGGMLEMSNVDLATEFTDMITAQRGFQANSRVISTTDEMLSELVNLKR